MAERAARTTHAPSPLFTSVVKSILLLIGHLPLIHASPLLRGSPTFSASEAEPLPAQDAALWIYLAVAAALVLLGGAFAGLTIALMGQVSEQNHQLQHDSDLFIGRNLSPSHQDLRRGF